MEQNSNNFFNGEKKEVYVCFDKDTEKYYTLLSGLVTEDKSVRYKTVRLSEKDFVDAKSVTSENRVIFIGASKYIKKNILPSINVKYDKFGMKYGWIGNTAILYVSDPIPSKDKYQQFLDYVKGQSEKYASQMNSFKEIDLVQWKIDGAVDAVIDKVTGNTDKDNLTHKIAKGGVNVARVASNLFSIGAITNTVAFLSDSSKMKVVVDQQYQIVLRNFVLEGFATFMGDK